MTYRRPMNAKSPAARVDNAQPQPPHRRVILLRLVPSWRRLLLRPFYRKPTPFYRNRSQEQVPSSSVPPFLANRSMLRPGLCLSALVLRYLRSAPIARGLPAERNCISLAPARLDRYPRSFTFYVGVPVSSIPRL